MINKNIRDLRILMKMSQVELAQELGVTKQCVSNWENDNILPSVEMLVKMAKFFNVTTDYLLGIDKKQIIDVSNLSSEQVAHIKLIVGDLENLQK